MKKAILYSPVESPELFHRVGFYRDDLEALSRVASVVEPTNSLKKVFTSRPDLVIGYFYSKSAVAALIGRLIGAKVILTGGADQVTPGVYRGTRLWVNRLFAVFCLLLAHRILVSCRTDQESFEALSLGIEIFRRKIVLAPHIVRSRGAQRSQRPGSTRPFRAFTICWMASTENVRRKGVHHSVLLVRRLREVGVDASLAIAGTDGTGQDFLINLVREHSLERFVNFLGPISEDEKYRQMAESDAYLQLSSHEGFGVAAAEAYLAGIPVVHTNRGGLRDVIGQNGIVVDVDRLLYGDIREVEQFFQRFLQFEPDFDEIERGRDLYSVDARAKRFLLELTDVQ